MIRITDVRLPLDYTDEDIIKLAAHKLRTSCENIDKASVFRRAVDARRKNDIHFTAAVDVFVKDNEARVLSKARNNRASICAPYSYKQPQCRSKPLNPPVVVGAGPAGLFAALVLARAGLCPILIERGRRVEQRQRDVEDFWETSRLDTESNVQFGEGGAGAFSDGKLTTGTKDSRTRFVLQELAAHGAPEEILYLAKPHIGTDCLKPAVKNIRQEIIALGGSVCFETKLEGLIIKNNRICGVEVSNANIRRSLPAQSVILAVGHSARDTFQMLKAAGVWLEPKPFSVGARIEHRQRLVNIAQYGSFASHPALKAADYKLSVHTAQGRGVYTFCMCPGGFVVAAASEENTVVTNGMSEFSRGGINANSALLTSVEVKDFYDGDPLSGVSFQRKIERAAFAAGGSDYSAPVQRTEDFLKNRATSRFGEVTPTYRPSVRFAKADDYLPEFVTASMRTAIIEMDKKLSGFAHPDALITGAETRSSSPVRILRGENMQSVNLKGLYPCGEGAGYAGGIVSAAVDGVKCAEQIILAC